MPSTRTSFDLTAAADPAALERRCRAVFGAGLQLPPDLRAQLERAVGQDLSAVRIHADADADALAAAVGADAVTAGVDIFFRAGSFRPDQPHGRRLIGHEIGHVVDPRGRSDLPRPGTGGLRIEGRAVAEEWADTVADHVDRGTRLPGCAPARPVGECEPLLLSRHASWEHRLLGDAPAADLNAIATGLPNRQQLLQDLRDFLFMWHQSPQSVTQQMINARYPYIRTLQLTTSGLLVTYGELNTLPDYLASPDVMDSLPAEYLLPILQAVRQEGYNKVQGLLNGSTASFAGSVAINSGWSMLDLLYETRAIDSLTQNFGPNGTDHYTGLVGRNACHFAPYSWYRWQTFYMIARGKALLAYQAQDPASQARLTRQAWINHGYADHFLQDSFAAGHLVNKTQIMQWFIEWAVDKWYVPVADWDQVKLMTTALQPGLSAQALYNQANPGNVRDPQTAEEQATELARMNMCGVVANGGTQEQSYLNYLAFLNSTVVQSSSGALHDHFNATSLWVTSVAQPQAFQIWGDDTMLNGGAGVGFASLTAHQSQRSIIDILNTGQTATTVQQLFDQFPTQVSSTQAGALQPLQQWNNGLQATANDLFPAVHYYLLRAYPRIGKISVDQPPAAAAMTLSAEKRDLVPAIPPSA